MIAQQFSIVLTSAKEPFNFDADPDPGSPPEKKIRIWIQIFADPDPGSQNLADPTDPDPKHWF